MGVILLQRTARPGTTCGRLVLADDDTFEVATRVTADYFNSEVQLGNTFWV
jgi:hypothetical protein